MSDATFEVDLNFTDAAANKVRQLIEDEGNHDLKLRVYVTGGGCSGFQYGFAFEETISEGDTVVDNGGVTLVVDPMSLDLIAGSTVDFVESLGGAAFKVENPQAAAGCGCGASFGI